jgi:Flp pilus assembly protein TadD
VSGAHPVWLLLRTRRHEEAERMARDALLASPDDPDLLHALSHSLSSQDRLHEALEVAEHACARHPDNPDLHYQRGVVLGDLQRGGESIVALEHAISLAPHSANLHMARAEAILEFRRHLPRRSEARLHATQQAEVSAIEAQRLGPGRAAPHLVAAKVRVAQQRWGDADSLVRRAMEIEPNSSLAHQLLGIIAQQRGNRKAAADHFVEAARLDPRSDHSLRLLRGLKKFSIPGGAVALFFLIRFAVGGAAWALTEWGPWVGLAIVAVALAFAGAAFAFVLAARRRRLGETAHNVLVADRSMRWAQRRQRWRQRLRHPVHSLRRWSHTLDLPFRGRAS